MVEQSDKQLSPFKEVIDYITGMQDRMNALNIIVHNAEERIFGPCPSNLQEETAEAPAPAGELEELMLTIEITNMALQNLTNTASAFVSKL